MGCLRSLYRAAHKGKCSAGDLARRYGGFPAGVWMLLDLRLGARSLAGSAADIGCWDCSWARCWGIEDVRELAEDFASLGAVESGVDVSVGANEGKLGAGAGEPTGEHPAVVGDRDDA